MQLEVPDLVLHLFSGVIGFGVACLFYILGVKTDFKGLKEEVGKLSLLVNRFVPFLEQKLLDSYVATNPTEVKLVNFIDNDHLKKRAQLFEKKKVDIFDFDEGWQLLLNEFFSGRPGILRDVTFSSHGDASFQKYDFASYPILIRQYVERDREKSHEVRFMMVCSPDNGDGRNNKLAEAFLGQLLRIKYPHCTETELLFDLWKAEDQGERPGVQIMITNYNILRRVAGLAIFDCPFNVYGDLAVSRSIVRGDTEDKPLPHLEVLVDQEDVKKASSLFDSVWRESANFRARALSEMSEEQKRDLGKGRVFHIWSSYEY